MYNWDGNISGNEQPAYIGLLLFVTSASLAIIVFLILHPHIDRINQESPILINVMFGPALAIGFLYGMRITERTMRPSEIRSPLRRSVAKILLFFFVIGGLFSSVNFALNGGSVMPDADLLEDGLLDWAATFVASNGGATFLIISSIALMAAATKRVVGMNTGLLNYVITSVGTFAFFSMLALSFTRSDPTNAGIFLHTFYQAGVIGGAFFAMNRFTKNLNAWEDFRNGY